MQTLMIGSTHNCCR